MKEIVIGIILLFLGWLFLYLPVMGFAYLYLGELALGLLYLLPLLCLIGRFLYRHYVIEPEKTRMAALSRMYKYPQCLGKKDTANQWYRGFKDVIHAGLITCTDPDKKSDLSHCLHVVEKMGKDCSFDGLNRAFRLTGCHLEVKDSTGHIITKIV